MQIYYKLLALTAQRLKLIQLFLQVMSGDDTERQMAKLDRMLPGLNNAVDMGLVQILAWCAYD